MRDHAWSRRIAACTSLLLSLTLAQGCSGPDSGAGGRITLATTTSTENSGLLEVLLPAFEKASSVKVDVVAAGTGKALRLAENGDGLVVVVQDDGVGFDPAEGLERPGCFGVAGMQERARRLGGALQVESAPGEGTRVILRIEERKEGREEKGGDGGEGVG